jgi:microcystin-dependent protein
MADPFVAEIRIFPFNFAPSGWATCDGQLLPLSQNTALFSLLGTTYGGNGKSNFALPDLHRRAPMHPNNFNANNGLSGHDLGESGGSETVSLLVSEIPVHNHFFKASEGDGTVSDPNGQLPAKGLWDNGTSFGVVGAYSTLAPNTNMAVQQLAPSGGDQPHNNMQPYLVLNFCIALQGVFPPRS